MTGHRVFEETLHRPWQGEAWFTSVAELSDIVEINLMAPYRFFQFLDTEGNLLEVGRMG